uniref:Uncharacterized protein n=1 Tax=Panagrolaimus sp. JU765 TaxID=591449 RepID=A0AC34QG92_9BILA
MNVITSATTSSPQCFSQTNSDCSPESGNDSMVGSVESIRDRSHLFLDPGSKRPFIGPRRNPNANAITTTTTVNGVNQTNPIIATTIANTNGFGIDGTSPMLPKDFLQIVNAYMSPGKILVSS